MARRIVYAEQSASSRDVGRALFIDRWIEIDCKPKVFVDRLTGEVVSGPTSYKVGLARRTRAGRLSLREYGRIKDPEDIAWLKQATRAPWIGGSRWIDEPVDVLSRVHHLGLNRDGLTCFAVEVLTGDDAKDHINKAKRERAIATLIDQWWLIPSVVVGLWLFF